MEVCATKLYTSWPVIAYFIENIALSDLVTLTVDLLALKSYLI